jgi:hypothetical protein
VALVSARLAHHRARDAGGALLVTRRAAVAAFRIPTTEHYIRKVCQPVACDVTSRAVLYDLDTLVARFTRAA